MALPERADLKKWLIRTVKVLIFVAVAAGIGHAIYKAKGDLDRQQIDFWAIDFRWLVASGLLYLAGMAPACFFWHRTLWAMGQQPTLLESYRAFYVSQVGKYIPGKAMVVVIRSAMMRSKRVDTVVAAVSVFVETLTYMAAGSMVASIILLLTFREQWFMKLLALGLLVCSVAPTLPPVFRRVVKFLRVGKASPKVDEAIHGITWRLMLQGWLINSVGWCFMGASLWAALKAAPGSAEVLADPMIIPLCIACVALATIAGFASLLPGGIGVRELVITTLISPPFGLMAAVIMRIGSLTAELLTSGILFALTPRSLREQIDLHQANAPDVEEAKSAEADQKEVNANEAPAGR